MEAFLYLHSNMVRFIMYTWSINPGSDTKFTFQYGQIYYSNLDYHLVEAIRDLHSNMVRFIITVDFSDLVSDFIFTFQYGQIYYYDLKSNDKPHWLIYIPIWLDLLYGYSGKSNRE